MTAQRNNFILEVSCYVCAFQRTDKVWSSLMVFSQHKNPPMIIPDESIVFKLELFNLFNNLSLLMCMQKKKTKQKQKTNACVVNEKDGLGSALPGASAAPLAAHRSRLWGSWDGRSCGETKAQWKPSYSQ